MRLTWRKKSPGTLLREYEREKDDGCKTAPWAGGVSLRGYCRQKGQTDSNQEYSHSNRVLLVCETQVGEISDLEAFCPSMLPVSLLLATCLLILLFIICVWEVGIPVPSGNLRVSLAVVCSQFFGCSWY